MVASVRTIDDVDLTHQPPTRISSVGGLSRCVAPAAFAVALVLATTGFRFGVGSDLYHLPYVLRLDALPQFAHDQFYQNLDRIVSLIWPLVRRVTGDGDAHGLFLTAYVISLALYFLALLHIVFRLGMREWPVLVLAGALLGLTYLDSGHSFLAGANIIGGTFTDTGMATALVAVSLALALNRRIVWALVVLGVAFDVRYEVALWGVAALLGVSVVLAWERIAIRRDWTTGGLIALLLAAPAIAWLAWSIGSAGQTDSDFLAYVAQVAPGEWLVSATSLQQWVMFVSMLALGLSAFSVLGPRAKLLCAAFLGFLAVFVIGCVLPFITDSHWLLTLRPMAADGLMQVLATVGAVTVVTQDIRYGGAGRVGLSLVIAASLLVSEYALPIGALAMLARAALAHGEMLGIERRVKPLNQHIVHNIAAPALLLVAVAGGVLRIIQPPQWIAAEPQSDPGFVALVQWAKDATPTESVFLVNGRPGDVFDAFQMLSRRSVWLDDARGASALWDSGYYAFWRQRSEQLRGLRSPQERLQFACQAGVDYYADRASDGFDPHAPMLGAYLAFDQDGYFVIDTRHYCRH